MKIRSISELLRDARLALERFPLALASAVVGALVMMRVTRHSYYGQHNEQYYLVNLAMIAALGITSLMSLRLFAETHKWTSRELNLRRLVLVAVLVLYYVLLPQHLKGLDINRYWLINLNLHLLVAIAPFLFLDGLGNSFWQYNKALFLRIFFAFIYSNTIYIGLAIALGVTDNLFDFIKFDPKIYSDLWLAVIGVFNTWFFFSGVPKDIPALDGKVDYPKGLRIFTQFVLIPLVVLYIFILYMYMAKIVVIWSLPKGWLSSFIIGVSVSGIMTLLLVHPLRDSEEFAWIRGYSRYFYLALFPLIVLMAVAVGRRIIDYGITEQRYFILLFTLWLLIVATRFTLRPRADIRFIPLTLFVLVAAATWGPWSAMSVSKWNQTARLESILAKEGLLVNGVLKKSEKKIDYKINSEISSIVGYLENNFTLKHLGKWVSPYVSVEWSKLSASDFVTKELGLEYNGYYSRDLFYRGYHDNYSAYFNFYVAQDRVADVAGYDYLVNFNLYSLNNRAQPFTETYETPQGKLTLSFDSSTGAVKASGSNSEVTLATFSGQWLKDARERFGRNGQAIPRKEMVFDAEQGTLRCRLQVTNMNGTAAEEKDAIPVLNGINGTLLFAFSPVEEQQTYAP